MASGLYFFAALALLPIIVKLTGKAIDYFEKPKAASKDHSVPVVSATDAG